MDLLKDIIIAMITGAYTGLVVTRYHAFNEALMAARRIGLRTADLFERMMKCDVEHDAANVCASLLMDPAANLLGLGYRRAAREMSIVSRLAQRGLLGIWQRFKKFEAAGDAAAAVREIESIIPFQKDLLRDVNAIPIDWVVLLFGDWSGRKAIRLKRWYFSFTEHLETGAPTREIEARLEQEQRKEEQEL